jgi:hypothetical protein
MDVSSDDEDLKRAITLSLQDQGSTSSKPKEVINLDSDDDATTDDDQAPYSLSKQVTDPKSEDETTTDGDTPPAPAKAVPPPTPANSMLGLDRKAMEEERLARKRKASISPPPPRKAPRIEKPDPNPQSVARTTSKSTKSNHGIADSSKKATTSPLTPSTRLSFPTGAVNKTFAFGHPRTSSDIRIEEVLRSPTLTLAVLSSFQWDVEWLLRKLDTHRTHIVLVMQAKDESTKQQYTRETADMPNLRLCFPSMEGQVNCMHSKLMLLSHPTYLRIVVPSANLVPYDWGETGVMENSLFLIDLPRLPSSKSTNVEEMTPFGQDLLYFLNAMGLDASIIQSLSHFDFSATRDYAFVHTIGGAHTGEAWRRTGYPGLGRAVQQLNFATAKELKIDFVASSIGSLNWAFLDALYLAAQGDDGLIELCQRTSKTKKSLPYPHANIIKLLARNFRIYFPTHPTVASSTGGPDCGGTICFSSKWYDSPTFPREVMRDCVSVRKGLLMHNKMLFVRGERGKKAWAYIGSANCSESAWGRLVQDRKTKAPKLNCRNWECGVVVPVRGGDVRDSPGGGEEVERWGQEEKKGKGKGEGGGKGEEREGMGVFEPRVPVPMRVPGGEYDGRRPWFCYER